MVCEILKGSSINLVNMVDCRMKANTRLQSSLIKNFFVLLFRQLLGQYMDHTLCLWCVRDCLGQLFIYLSVQHSNSHACNIELRCKVTYYWIWWPGVIPGQPCTWLSGTVSCEMWLQYLLRHNKTFFFLNNNICVFCLSDV